MFKRYKCTSISEYHYTCVYIESMFECNNTPSVVKPVFTDTAIKLINLLN